MIQRSKLHNSCPQDTYQFVEIKHIPKMKAFFSFLMRVINNWNTAFGKHTRGRKIKIIHSLIIQNQFLIYFGIFIPSAFFLFLFFNAYSLFGSCTYGHIIYPAFDTTLS